MGAHFMPKLKAAVLPLAMLALLEIYARTWGLNSGYIAPPSAAATAFYSALFSKAEGSVLQATAFTLGSAGAGLLLGSLLGMTAGVLLGFSRVAAHMSFATIEMLRPLPSVALIPLSMMIFGFGYQMEIAVVAFATFWPILLLTKAAVEQVEPRLLEVARALNLGTLAKVFKIVLPSILPRLFVALRLGVAIALVVAVTVEVAANPNGMGYALMLSQQTLQPDLMLAWLFWIGVVGYAINAITLSVQRKVGRCMGESGERSST
jgi:sulfonate transport system permease protein